MARHHDLARRGVPGSLRGPAAAEPGRGTAASLTLNVVVRISGPLDTGLLDGAYDDLIARNDVLRSTVEPDGTRWVQRVHPHRGAALEQVDAAGRTPAELAAAWAAVPVPTDQPPLARGFLAALGPEEHLLGLALHHLHTDPRSLTLAVRELAAAYEARLSGSRLPAPAEQFGPYTALRLAAANARPAEERRAWLESFAGARAMGYTCDRDIAAAPSAAGVLQRRVLDADAANALEHAALRRRSTFFAALLTGFSLGLAEHVAHRDLVMPTIFEQRDTPRARAMIGPFLHPSLLRVRVPVGSTFDSLSPHVRDVVLAAYRHTTVTPAEVYAHHPGLAEALGTERGAACIFQYLPAHGRTRPVSFGPATTGVVQEPDQRPGPTPATGMMFRLRRTDTGDVVARISYDTRHQSEDAVLAVFDDFRARLDAPLAERRAG
ncbi:MAG: hypothetical protein HOV68_00880 [Streptomycetaceae bacterium]|nr:hypothetical protein [Streptomycetaceae bacterium]